MAETKLDPKQIGGSATSGSFMRHNGTDWTTSSVTVPHIIRVGISQGKPAANIEFARYKAPRAIQLDSGYTDGVNYFYSVSGTCRINPTAPAAFTVKKNGVLFLTVTFNTNGTVTDSWSGGPFNLNAGDVLTFHTPTTQDATLLDLSFSIVGRMELVTV